MSFNIPDESPRPAAAPFPAPPGSDIRGGEREAAASHHGNINASPYAPDIPAEGGLQFGQWEQVDPLEAPAPRPGYEQRWVYIGYGNPNDSYAQSEWTKAVQQGGYRPRQAVSVDAGPQLPWLRTQTATQHSQNPLDGYIVKRGMVLMEREEWVGRERVKYMRLKTHQRTSALEVNLQKAFQETDPNGVLPQRSVNVRVNATSNADAPLDGGFSPPR